MGEVERKQDFPFQRADLRNPAAEAGFKGKPSKEMQDPPLHALGEAAIWDI